VIAFGVAISDRQTYERFAEPSIRQISEADTCLLIREGYDSIQRPYNEIMEEAVDLPGLEALVLMHQDAELLDGSILTKVRSALQDPLVGIVGPHGWRHSTPGAPPLGLRTVTASRNRCSGLLGHEHSTGRQEADLIDGVIMALAPWVVRSIRFDMRLAERFHGYDLDLSLRVRAAGGKLICDAIPILHHMSRPWRDRGEYVQALVELARRWDPDVRPIEWAPTLSPIRR
jgi:Glycosyltransferase like family